MCIYIYLLNKASLLLACKQPMIPFMSFFKFLCSRFPSCQHDDQEVVASSQFLCILLIMCMVINDPCIVDTLIPPDRHLTISHQILL